MHYHRLRCSASLSFDPCFASSSIVSMPRSLSAFCRFVLAAVSIQSVAQVHTMRHELYFLKSSAHSSLELPLRYSIPSSVLLLFWTGICFLTFAVPFEETCVVFSNSFVRQIQHTARHSSTYSLISLHSGARDADMMKFFLTGSSLCFPQIVFEFRSLSSHKSMMLLLVDMKLGSEACQILSPLIILAPGKWFFP